MTRVLVDAEVAPRSSWLQSKKLVLRKSAGELAIFENENWAAALRHEVRRAIDTDLRRALQDRSADPGYSATPGWQAAGVRQTFRTAWSCERVARALAKLS